MKVVFPSKVPLILITLKNNSSFCLTSISGTQWKDVSLFTLEDSLNHSDTQGGNY